MAKNNSSILFDNIGFRLPLLRGFPSKVSKDYLSNNNPGDKSTLYRPALKALLLYFCDGRKVWDEALTEEEIYESDEGVVAACGKVGKDVCLAEYQQSDEVKHIACFDSHRKQFLFAGITQDNGKTYQPYVLDYMEGRVGTVLWLAMMPYLSEANEEFKVIFDNLAATGDSLAESYRHMIVSGDNRLPKSVISQCFLFCDACYYTVDRDGFSANIPCGVPSSTRVFPGTPGPAAATVYKPQTVISGAFTLEGFSDGSNAPVKKAAKVSVDDLFCMYALEDNMTDEQKARAQKMYPSYVTPKWVLKAAHNIKFHHSRSLAQNLKQKNLFLFGPPGSGKTDGSMAIASALGLPFTHISISSNSDETVFTGNIIPEIEEKGSAGYVSDPIADLKYRSLEEMVEAANMAPDMVYEDLAGEYREDATTSDCWQAYASRVADRQNSTANNNGNGISYKFVESSFIHAVENGWLVTIEEFTNARDTGIGIILNGLMDGYQEITLPTGQIIHRHPNCVIVFASNVDEAQCGEFEASMLSRLKPMYRIELPSKGDLIERVRSVTGFNERDVLEKMADVVIALQKYIREHALVGVCGVREFVGWVVQYEANKDFEPTAPMLRLLRDSAMETIVPSASPHEEDITDVTRDIIDTMLSVI